MMKIGNYEIKQIDEDYFKVVHKTNFTQRKCVLCGGDFETILATLFVQGEISEERLNNTEKH